MMSSTSTGWTRDKNSTTLDRNSHPIEETLMKPTSARERLEAALGRIDDPKGEGARACLTVYRDQAKAAADAADARAKAGVSLGPLDGTIVSIKDLFDVAGEVTRVGSKVFAEEGKPATADAPVVRRLRAGGAVIVAKTNMSEFAYTGIGANPHLERQGNPADRKRVPGGSSSGAAVAGRRRHVRDRDRHRHWRLMSYSRRIVRDRRLQAEPAAHSDDRCVPVVVQH
jgi:Asp-tRNA(Asn)/Glu-tRNA(Gln) amidotransferase A subunit family amidase